jgi:hypothetical protein
MTELRDAGPRIRAEILASSFINFKTGFLLHPGGIFSLLANAYLYFRTGSAIRELRFASTGKRLFDQKGTGTTKGQTRKAEGTGQKKGPAHYSFNAIDRAIARRIPPVEQRPEPPHWSCMRQELPSMANPAPSENLPA